MVSIAIIDMVLKIKKKKERMRSGLNTGCLCRKKSMLPTELLEAAWKWVLEQGLTTYGEELSK
jgi:hypothetical protein